MTTKGLITTVAITAFSAGFIAGNGSAISAYSKRIKKLQPLYASTFQNVILKASSDEMSTDELREYINNELNFLHIVLRRGNYVEND